MSSQATQFATAFDRLGRRILAQFESLPEGLWDRTPLSFHRETLLTLATRFLEENEYWVLVTIGGQRMGSKHSIEASAVSNVHMAVLERYERWNTEMHRVLSRLPDTIMNLFVAVPLSARSMFDAESITVRECLLYALEQSSLLVGRMESLGQMFAESERFLHELFAAREIGSRPDARAGDTRATTNVGRAGVARTRPNRCRYM